MKNEHTKNILCDRYPPSHANPAFHFHLDPCFPTICPLELKADTH